MSYHCLVSNAARFGRRGCHTPEADGVSLAGARLATSLQGRSERAAASRRASAATPIQREQILCQTHHRPFGLDLRQAPQQKLAELPRALDQAEDGFHNRLATGVQPSAPLRAQAPLHPLPNSQSRRGPSPRTGRPPLAMSRLLGRDQRLAAHGPQFPDVGLTEVARIGQEHAGRLPAGARTPCASIGTA